MGKIRILITDGMAENGLKILQGQSNFEVDCRKGTPPEELATIVSNYEVVVIRSATTLTGDLINKGTSLQLIVRAGAGVDNIDVPVATEKKIPVMNTASANSLAAAEQTIALLFSLYRHIPQSWKSLQDGKWERANFKGREVSGKTLGLVGLGNIGRLVAEKAIGLGMNVVAFDPMVNSLSAVPALAKFEESIQLAKSLDDLLVRCDVLTVHVPKSKATANLISKDQIAKMKDDSVLLNCARGGVVDEKAVLEGVESGKLSGAAFDVFEKEPPEFPNSLFNHPKIICVPHLGASTFEAQKRVASTAAEQMIGFFERNEKQGVINLK